MLSLVYRRKSQLKGGMGGAGTQHGLLSPGTLIAPPQQGTAVGTVVIALYDAQSF